MSTLLQEARIARTRSPTRAVLLFSVILLCQAHGYAQLGPQPPCGMQPALIYPGLTYPALNNSPSVESWSRSELGLHWSPPACTGWTATGFTSLVTTVARFTYTLGADGLLRHIGAVSQYAGIRYWSTSHKQWKTLIVDAHAGDGLPMNQRRGDFTAEEMRAGSVLYFEQVDNLSGRGIYAMHILEASADRIVINVENVSTLHYLFVTAFHPGEMQTIYFLDRESETVWRYYSILRIGKNANQTMTGNESSAKNRAVAFYRYLVGIPTDQEPPAAR